MSRSADIPLIQPGDRVIRVPLHPEVLQAAQSYARQQRISVETLTAEALRAYLGLTA